MKHFFKNFFILQKVVARGDYLSTIAVLVTDKSMMSDVQNNITNVLLQ